MEFSIIFIVVLMLSFVVKSRVRFLQITIASQVLQLIYAIKFSSGGSGYNSYFLMTDEFVILYILRFFVQVGLPFQFIKDNKTMAAFFLVPVILTPVLIIIFPFSVSGALTNANLTGFGITQLGAMLRFVVMLLLASCIYEELCQNPSIVIKFVYAVIIGFCLVIFFAVIQIILRKFHSGWPTWIFNVDRSVYPFWKYKLFRLSSSFVEASVAAKFYCVFFAVFFVIGAKNELLTIRGGQVIFTLATLLSMLLICLSISSTAWLCFVIMLCGFSILNSILNNFSLNYLYLVCILSVVGILTFIFHYNHLMQLLDDYFLNKLQSGSFNERHSADSFSVTILLSTFFLGKGLGTYRSSSLVTNYLAQIGLIPTLFFIYNIFKIFAGLVRSYIYAIPNIISKVELNFLALIAGCCAAIITNFISKPDMVWLDVILISTSLYYCNYMVFHKKLLAA